MTVLILNNTKEYIEYDATGASSDTVFTMTLPNNVTGTRDRIVLMVSYNTSSGHNFTWSGTPILWQDNDEPSRIGDYNSDRETMKIELWKDPLTGHWLGSYIRYTQNGGGGSY